MHQIIGTVNYVSEGMNLLFHMAEGEKYSELKDSLSRKYYITFVKGAKIFALLEQIEKSAQQAFQKKQEDLKYYFGISSEKKDRSGRILLLWDEYSYSRFHTLQELKDYLDSLSDETYCSQFAYYLQGYGDRIREDSQYEEIDSPYHIITYLMSMDISMEEKWKLQEFFVNHKTHFDKALSLLATAIEVLMQYANELNELAKEFYIYWSNVFRDTTPESYIIEKLHLNIDSNPLGSILSPSIIAPNTSSLHFDLDDNGVYKIQTNIIMGILFGDEFAFNMPEPTDNPSFDSHVLQVLKLLSDKSKFEILTYIRDKKAYGSELAKHLNLTTATISHHMSALFEANLITIEKEDNRVYYRANRKMIEEVLSYCHKTLTE